MPEDPLKVAYRDRMAWMEDVLADPALSNGEKVVAMRLALHKNVRTSRCDPGIETISKGVAMRSRNVQYTLGRLEERGWIRRRMGGHGPRNTTQYDLLRVHLSAPLNESARVQEDEATVQPDALKGAKTHANGRTAVRPNLDNIQENHGTVYADMHSDDFRNLYGKEERHLSDNEIDLHFEEFFNQYPRAVDHAKARAEYRKVIKSGRATAEELLHAVMLYAAARERADQPEYTKTPAKWLLDESWKDDPEAHALGEGGHRGAWKRAVKQLRRSIERERV
jgi:hypothetical protein